MDRQQAEEAIVALAERAGWNGVTVKITTQDPPAAPLVLQVTATHRGKDTGVSCTGHHPRELYDKVQAHLGLGRARRLDQGAYT